MNNSSRHQKQNNSLNSNSKFFLQLGIILALIIVYSILELSFSGSITELPKKDLLIEEPFTVIVPNFTIEKTEIKQNEIKEEKKLKRFINEYEIDNNIDESGKYQILISEPEPKYSLDSIVEVIEPEPDEKIYNILLVEQAPIFPGCEGKNKEELRKCFNKSIAKFVNRKFDTNLASEAGLSGKNMIFVLFEIDKNGEIINIKPKAPHRGLEKEAKRIVMKLPKMIPGKQGGKPVNVRYALPITLYVK
ncbi:MAG: energy transducer TonB [Bacteroidota bacterium]